jgi:hypothetical protein
LEQGLDEANTAVIIDDGHYFNITKDTTRDENFQDANEQQVKDQETDQLQLELDKVAKEREQVEQALQAANLKSANLAKEARREEL